ncbi:MAG: branched-chain amino acid ABC transporter permease [Armatimonadota bacterium]|nr:branched-chain amino acid ABC transporter permease [Armatimonadota bacterium]
MDGSGSKRIRGGQAAPVRLRNAQVLNLLPFLFFLVCYAFAPRVVNEAQLTTIIYIGIYVLLAVGLNLLMGYAGQISLGHAAFFGIGAYTSGILTAKPIANEVIPGVSVGFAVLSAVALFLLLTRVSGWKLGVGIVLLVLLGWLHNLSSIAPAICAACAVVVMGVFGLVAKVGWSRACVSGAVLAILANVSKWFLRNTLERGGASPWTGLLVGIFLTAVISYLIGSQVLRLRGHYLAMATLAFGVIVEIVFRQWTAVTGGSSDGIFNIPPIQFFSCIPGFMRRFYEMAAGKTVDLRTQYYYLVWAFVFIAIVLAVNIVRSRVGRAFRAVHSSEQAAASLGVDTARYKVQVFVLSACMASVAGTLHAHNAGIGYIHPSEFGFMVSVELVVMVVLGGMASVWGSLFGAAAIQTLKDTLLDLEKTNPEFWGLKLQGLDPIVFGAVLIVVMIVLPQGLVRGFSDGLSALWRGAGRIKKQQGVG